MSIVSFVVIGLLSAFGVAALMEFYKKTIRKGHAAAWENWVVGAVVSAGISALVCYTGLAYPFFGNMIINVAVYAVAFFLIQMFLDMKVIKKLIINALETMDIDKFINTVLAKLGLTVEKIRGILQNLGITRAKLEKTLLDAGLSEEKVKEILDLLYPEDTKAKKAEG